MSDTATTQKQQLRDISRRLMRLDSGKQHAFVSQLAAKGVNLAMLPIVRQGRKRAPLSFAQARLWFLWRMDPSSAAYNISATVRVRGQLQPRALQQAFDMLVARHSALRTVFRQEGEQAEQVIQVPQPAALRHLALDGDDRERQARELARQEASLPFDLEAGPLMRATLLTLDEGDHFLVVSLHHIVADGWSMGVLVDEFWKLYAAFACGEEPALPEPEIDYADYAEWQRLWMSAVDGERQVGYWTRRLADPAVLQLPIDRPRPAVPDLAGSALRIPLDRALADGLRGLARRHRTTLFAVLLASFKLLLYRYTGQSDINIGVPVANRHRGEARGVIGLFVNTQVLRTQIDGRAAIRDFIAAVHAATVEAQENQDLPFERLLEILQPTRSLSQNPLFQVLYNHQRRRVSSNPPNGTGLQIETIETEVDAVKFDLALDTDEGLSGEIRAVFTYATALFEAATIERLAAHWATTLKAMVADDAQGIADVALLSEQELGQLRQWNRAADETASSSFTPVHRTVARLAAETPDAPALVFGDGEISYAELNRRANRLAHHLIRLGVGRDDLVGVSARRSPHLVAALLAILKTGAAYLPLDPEHPARRQIGTLRDAGARVVLIDADGSALTPPPAGVEVVPLGAIDLAKESESDPEIAVVPTSLAYVIYTSGSTGIPKGVAVEHGPFAMHCEVTAGLYDMDRHSRELHFLSFTFDGAHERLWTALTCGAALVMRDADLWSAEQTIEVLRRQRVTNAGFPPAYLQQLADFAMWRGDPPPVELYSFGGEAMPKAGFDKVKRALKPRALINGYGPTETVVTPLVWKVDASEEIDGNYAPIGRPVGRRSAYILDNDFNIVPVGVTGELFIGGEGLARGYWQRAELTADRFVPDPFGAPGARLYRTGDLARWRADGVIEYVGRTDHQVKIRGFRIELGEIEAWLMRQAGVRSAVVVALEASVSRQLVGYVAGDGPFDEAAMRAALSDELPDYMVPARIVRLDRLPLTAHGKVDRDALPAPEMPAATTAHVAPRSAAETVLAAIWAELLGQPAIGATDNFFELGGDSIISLQLVGRARQAGLLIEPRDVFRHQTLQDLARVARSEDRAEIVAAEIDLDGREHLLLPIQLRFLSEDAGDRHHWNQAVLLMPKSRLDWKLVELTLAALVAHHAALRLRFEEIDGGWRATYGATPPTSELLWILGDLQDAAAVTKVASQAQASLSLAGPLLRVVGMDLADGSQRLLVVVHHLVIDGVSWRVLLEDFATAYDQLRQGAASVALARSDSYASWGARLQAYAATDELAAELDYWLERGSHAAFPCDDDHGGVDRVADGEEVLLAFDAGLTTRLLKEAPSAYRTQVNDLLLAALARAVSRWGGIEDVVVELEGHGREDVFAGADVSRTIGWFTTAFPVRLSGSSEDDASLIKSIKEELRAVPNRGLGYGILRHLGTEAQRSALATRPEPRIVFNYLGQFDSSMGESAPFRLAPESSGPMRSDSAPLGRWVSINGQVGEGQLRLSFSYGRRRYRRATIERLAEHYAASLRELVAHCTGGARGITPSDFALSNLKQADLDALVATIDCREIEDIYPLSPMQQGMLFHALRDGESGNYVNQIGLEVRGLEAGRLRAAWHEISSRHAVLRTGFAWRELSGAAQQVVYRSAPLPFEEEDWRSRAVAMEEEELRVALAGIAQAERTRAFDLSQAPLQRVRLIRLDEARHWLIWTHHHILLDGWSAARLMAEILQHERGARLSAVKGRYRDYIAWLQRQDRDASASFWRSALAELDEPSFLADTLGRPAANGASGHGSSDLLLTADLTASLQAFARRERVTLNTLVQGAWAQLLRRHTGQRAVCFGATVSGRPAEISGAEEMVGLFINTLPVVDQASPQTEIGAWLRDLQARNTDLRDHGWMPLYEIQRLAGRSGCALFDNILVFENYPIDQALRGESESGRRFGRVEQVSITNYALTVAVFAKPDGINLGFRYDRSRLDHDHIRYLQASLSQLLARIVADASRPLGALDSLDADEEQRLLGWGGSAERAPKLGDTIVAQIEGRAAASPSSIALIFGERQISYGELNARANRLAWRLREHGISRDRLVGLALERSIELIVGVLAVLKAEGAYLPLDPDYPSDRLLHMLRDSGTALVLIQERLLPHLASVITDADVEAWTIDGEAEARIEAHAGNPGAALHPDSLAYVMYTSGSTGVPKGVACSHRALAARLDWMQAEYRLDPAETLLHKTPFSFDVSVWEILWPLATGARLVIAAPGAHREPRLLVDAVIAHDVTTLHFVPQMLEHFVTEPGAPRCTSLRRLFAGGEALSLDLMTRVRAAFPHVRFDNRYGPTEALINATYWTCRDEDGTRVPIGQPIPGVTIRILDADLNMVPAGVTGELFIGGAGLARGYWRREKLTAERFIPDPFGEQGERLYRSGDLARWRADGAIDYVGRADHQVKIRGFRIELGEIEARLLEQPGVRSAVVVAREVGAGRQLVGYVSGTAELEEAALRTALSAVLPDYMVPPRIAVLERLPLMPSGKVDRQALPAPDMAHGHADHQAPRTPAEIAFAAIWAELLGRPAVGLTDNFFELGGDSIISLQMVSRARRAGYLIEPRDVFQHQTLEALARAARTEQRTGTLADQGQVIGPHPLLPIQSRFFAEDMENRDHWNQAVLLHPRERLDWNVMRRALAAVVDHHDALRLRFEQKQGSWYAEHGAAVGAEELLWVRQAAGRDAVTALASSAQASLSISGGELLRAVGIDVADGSQRFLIVIHHLVVDGMSWRILLEDVASAYRQLAKGDAAAALPPKTHAHALWGQRLRAYATSPELATELPYWTSRCANADVPCDEDHAGNDRIADADEVLLSFESEWTRRLLTDAPAAYRTQINDLLLAGLARAVWQWSGQDDVLVELEGHGREPLAGDLDLSRTVGWFTTAFPVRLAGGSEDPSSLIKTVKEELRVIPGRGLGYGVLRYLGSEEQRLALSHAGEPKIAFNYLGQIDGGDEAALFKMAAESAGRSRDASSPLRRWLTVNGTVRDGRLFLSFGFGRKRYRRETVERLAALYEAALRELVDHCTGGACGLTPSDVALSGLGQTELDRLALDWREIEDIYPLSPMQQGMLFHAMHDGESGLYVNQVAAEIRGLEAGKLRRAWQAASDRHAVLRTGFIWRDLPGAPQQVVYRRAEVPFIEDDWRARSATWDQAQLDAALADVSRQEQAAGFDLSRPPLQRVRLIRLGNDRHWLIWTHHHILLDGWSSARFIAEVMQHNGEGRLPPLRHRYRDYIAWLKSRDSDASAAFWRNATAGLVEPSFLAGSLAEGGDVETSGHGMLALELDPAMTGRLQEFAARERITMNTLVQAAWAQLLRQHTGQGTVCFGVTVSGRPPELAGAEEMVGLFINTLPVIDGVSPQQAVGAWLRELQDRNLALREFGATPLYEIQRLAGRPGRPLFDSILVFENYPVDRALIGQNRQIQVGETWIVETSNYPLFASIGVDERLRLVLNYQRKYFDEAQIARLQRTFVRLIEALSMDADRPVGMIAARDPADDVLLARANDTRRDEPREGIIAQFEAQVRKSPQAIALVFGEVGLSYAALNARANRLARRLRDHGVGTEIVVGLALDRGVGMLVALLAVLKAGGAYLPLDPDYPPERLAHMLRDSGAALVLTQQGLHDQFADILAETGAEAWLVDGQDGEGSDAANLDVAVHGESLAYVIYTSGSTGLPKGVMVRHDAVTNFLATMAEQPGMTAADRVLGLTSLSFDIAVLELWLPLTIGACVVLADRAAAHDPAGLKAIVERHGVSLIQATPSTWRMLLDHDGPALPASCRVLCGGEALPPDLARRLVAQAGEVWNLYGPTETTVWSARHRLDAVDDRPLLGRPIGNTTLYVLDGDLNLAPVGVAGELYIGGSGLARGYWQRGALTAERFIPDPFGPPGARLYRTGDVARWRSDGVLDYVGRADYQVKIRGFRIELGEIEVRLQAQPGVRAAVVVAREAGTGRQLVGYVSGEALDGAALKTALSPVLPDYMVPARIVVLERLPLTPNGKIDRKALPAPDQLAESAQHVAPRTPAEVTLAAIWADLLRQPNIGVTDNFFELGGDSIISLQMVSRARREGVLIEPRDVFRHQTIELLIASSRDVEPDKEDPASERGSLAGLSSEQLERLGLDWSRVEDVYPLSPMQQGMLFHSLRDAGSGVYVNQVSVEIRGLDPERLGTAWREVSARHQMLRTGFLWRELSGSPLQAVYRDAIVPFAQQDWRGQAISDERIAAALADERAAEFDLQRPPLQRVRLLRLQDHLYRLIWTYHHILMDGWSSARFVGEVLECYYGGAAAANATRYRDYIAWLQAQDAKAAEAFWREQLRSFDQPTQLADAFGARRHQASGHERCYTRLGEAATAELKAFARRERITLNTVVQGVWALLLQRYTGQNTVTFGGTVAGRPAGLDGSQQMLGLFINTLPVIDTIPPESPIGEWLRALQDRNSAIREYEHTPLYDIQGWAGRAGQTMFDSIIVFENYPIERSMHRGAGGLQFSGLKNVDVTNYPMDLSVLVEDTLQVEYTYMPSHFTAVQATQIKAQFELLLAELTRDATVVLGSIHPVTELDAALADRCNRHATSSAPLPLVHEAISSHAHRHPERTALTIGSSVLSFGDLERRANRLAHHLIARGLKPEQRVGVVVERTAATMIALLAVLKAGGAYVPLDPELPSERRAFVMRDAAIAFLLTGPLEIEGSPDGMERISLSSFEFDAGPDHPPQPELHPENLAYLIYTSGSTGTPKGVAVAHGPLAMHCRVTGSLYEIDESSCELHFLSLAFDGAHERWLTVLSHGARLLMRDAELWTPEQTVENLHAHRVSHIGLPPAYLQQVADCVEQSGNPPPVKLYSFGGEAMPKAGFDKVRRVLKPRILINGYGPTETVVTPLVWKVDGASECDTPYAPIGVPVGDRRAYILDAALDIIPAGVAGELYLGGFGLARCYHGKAGMTAERFVPDPFSSAPGARLYRTGDLARWREDGTVEYLGRSDDQVKVNGFRIELGEIQTSLLRHEAIAQAAVVAVPGAAGNQLIAYVAPKAADDAAPDAAETLVERLTGFLKLVLPAYMVPARIVVLERLPTLSSGKIDRRALPAPDASMRSFVPPRTPAEIAMARLWSEILEVPQVGVTDNFFELGGNSILCLKVVARVRQDKTFGIEIKLRDLLQKPTIRALLAGSATAASAVASAPSALLPLNAAVRGVNPVFAVHGGFGTVFDYGPLARRLEGHRQLIGLQSRMLVDPSWTDASLEAMAVDYAAEIRRMQPRGPYSLVGWSLGGLLVGLVAAELERGGERVDRLALVDSFVLRQPDGPNRQESMAHWADDLAGLLSAVLPSAAASRIKAQVEAAKRADLPETPERIRDLVASVVEQSRSVRANDASLGADDLSAAFAVGRHLNRLAQNTALPRGLEATPLCWWTSTRLAQRDRLESQMPKAVDRGFVGDNHFTILRDAGLLDEICGLLVPAEASTIAQDTVPEPAE
ncbi:non-ribosomal peptide synthase/polyketide synthase [Bradyrhizobium sp. IC3069]|uniref:non-ribosomal peptide synthase/polyketide synthase n=2 Tax=Hyphomicrobiales TaxID=356 RepID=UPI001CD26623|nr:MULTISPECIES: non-ribosomal peptide synthase/polyketide synthase [unclassified Bradyrhizobium]MCA1359979.1 non-ribosomal peptide synthase/polyketide synthase [Bradyrhizobium sp. IC4059]MCA1516469.1 non-ribosomal peptide synthase/polyketide synthase [Bradyrhizobium sp. IC3069]